MRDIKTVSFFSRSDRDALGHLRFYGPARQLDLHVIEGVEKDRVFPERAAQGDLVVLQRDFPSFLTAYEEIVRLAHREGRPVVFDLDDLLLELPPYHPDRQSHYYAKALLPVLQALTEADAVTVSTTRLRGYALEYNPNVIVLPNCLDEEIWHMRAPASVPSADGTVVIGYMGGASHAPDLEMIEPVLNELDNRYPGRLRFCFWGVKPPRSLASRPNVHWESVGISTYPEFADYFQRQSADIFIAPLQESLFNACKSPIKYLEYSALGGCGVFSRIDPYSSVIEDGVHGLLAASLPEWTDALSRLVEDRDLRLRLAANAQEDISANWLLSKNANRWLAAYEASYEVIGRNRSLESPFHELVRSLSHQIAEERDERVSQLSLLFNGQLAEKEREISLQKGQLAEKEQALQSLDSTLQGIYGSRAWKLLQLLREARERLSQAPKPPQGQVADRVKLRRNSSNELILKVLGRGERWLAQRPDVHAILRRYVPPKLRRAINSIRGINALPPVRPEHTGPSIGGADSEDYVDLSERIASANEARRGRLVPKKPAIISLNGRGLREAASSIRFTRPDNPAVTIIIPVHNRLDLTLECLTTIQRHTDGGDFDIVVVDDASDAETAAGLALIQGIIIISNEGRLGFTRSCNKGAESARGRYLLFLNNDVQVINGWLENLLAVMVSFSDAGAVGPKVLYPDGRLQEAGALINQDGTTTLIGLGDDPESPRYNSIREVDYCSGVCLLLKADVFRSVGGFDESYAPAYYEDVDLCLKLHAQGLKIYYCPYSSIVHHLSATTASIDSALKIQLVTRNRQKLLSVGRL